MSAFDKGWNDQSYNNSFEFGSKEYDEYQLGWDQHEMFNWT